MDAAYLLVGYSPGGGADGDEKKGRAAPFQPPHSFV